MYVNITNETDVEKSDILSKVFPDLDKKIRYEEKGEELFMKITKDINRHNQEDARQVEKVFKMKFPMITYTLIAINILFFIIPVLFGEYSSVIDKLCNNASLIRNGEYYRLLTCMFVHNGIVHLTLNCYSLYVLGTQMESFLGKIKFTIIYIVSGLAGSLLSMAIMKGVPSVGASGAIFCLLGSMIYFGYHYRVYLGNVIKSQIIPITLLNLAIGFIIPGIDNSAHIGGLIGGTLMTMALGIDNKSTAFEKVNGWIITTIYIIFVGYMAFVYTA